MEVALTSNDMPESRWPLICTWREPDQPVPVRTLRAPRRARTLGMAAPPWLFTGFDGRAFDFCAHMRPLCTDITARCEEFRHVDVARMLFAVTRARSRRAQGLYARVTPMRFRNGQLTKRRRGTTYQVQRYFFEKREILYVVTFCLPRFLDLDFDEKLITIFHELYHISPAFDGDLRRHCGRYTVHSHSKRCYDSHMKDLARAYLAGKPDPGLHAFLRLNFGQLQERHGSIIGAVVPRPKLVPVGGC